MANPTSVGSLSPATSALTPQSSPSPPTSAPSFSSSSVFVASLSPESTPNTAGPIPLPASKANATPILNTSPITGVVRIGYAPLFATVAATLTTPETTTHGIGIETIPTNDNRPAKPVPTIAAIAVL